MKLLILLMLAISLTNCAPSVSRDGYDGKDGVNGIDGKDGTNGVDGKDGADGQDGEDGQDAVLEIIDPCGDGPGHDEVLLVMFDGSILAWYYDLGLSLLEEGVTYQTTDAQRCRFQIIEGTVEEL